MGGRIGEVDSVDEERIQVSLNKSVKDTHEVSDYSPYGIDSRPEKGAKVALFNLGGIAHKLMMGVKTLVINTKSKPGETRLYSKTGAEIYLDEDDNITIQTSGGAVLIIREDGKIELNGNGKSSMTFDDFVTVWNAKVAHDDAHIHPDPVSGFTGPPTIATPPPAADMSAAENDKVLM